MELLEIVRRAIRVLSAIEGRAGLDQLDRASVDVLLRIAEGEVLGEVPTMRSFTDGSGEGREAVLSRLEALERTGWLSFSASAGGPGTQLHLSRRAKRAFVATAVQLQRHHR